jgi:uncharacterized coiled-coil protein SlyX
MEEGRPPGSTEEARKPIGPPVRGTPEYWTWRPEMLEAKRAEQKETVSCLRAQIEKLAQRVEKLQAPTDYQARKMRRTRREAGEWQRRMQEEAESERYHAGLQLLNLAGDKGVRTFFGYARQHKGVAYLRHRPHNGPGRYIREGKDASLAKGHSWLGISQNVGNGIIGWLFCNQTHVRKSGGGELDKTIGHVVIDQVILVVHLQDGIEGIDDGRSSTDSPHSSIVQCLDYFKITGK